MKLLKTHVLPLFAFFAAVFWLSLPPTFAAAPVDGKWDNVITLPFQPIHMVLLKNRKVLAVGGQDDAPNPCILFDTTTDDPSAQFLTPEDPFVPGDAKHNLFCSGHAALADGRIVFHGGDPEVFGNKTTIYDPGGGATTAAFEFLAELSPAWRYYPTLTTLADGRLLAMGGFASHDASQSFRTPGLFDVTRPPGLRWKTLPGAEYCTSDLTCPTNNFYVHFYPFMFQLSDGLVLYAGEGEQTKIIDPPPIKTRTLDVAQEQWSAGFPGAEPYIDGKPIGGSAVMYKQDHVMKAGALSGEPANDKVYRLDASSGPALWEEMPILNQPRFDFYLIALPDGTVVAMGGKGAAGHTLAPELIDPNAAQPAWTLLAPMASGYGRSYHSVALLLPDARVMVAGGADSGPDCPSEDETCDGKSAQIFYPPHALDHGIVLK